MFLDRIISSKLHFCNAKSKAEIEFSIKLSLKLIEIKEKLLWRPSAIIVIYESVKKQLDKFRNYKMEFDKRKFFKDTAPKSLILFC